MLGYFLQGGHLFGVTFERMNELFSSLKLPDNNAATKGRCDKVSILFAHKNICNIVFIRCKFFVSEEDFATQVIKTGLKLGPAKDYILLSIDF